MFGTLGALIGGSVAGSAAVGMKGVMDDMGMNAAKIEELTTRMQNGDETAMQEMEALLDKGMGSMGDDMPAAMKGRMIGMFAPLIGIATFFGGIIAVFSHAYFLLLALSPTQDAMVVLKKTPKLFFPLLGLWIWMFLRSFVWIPFLGLIPALILGPRFMAAPIILVKEKKGIMESVSLSLARTKGYWGKIVGNAIVVALCVILTGIVAGIVIGIIGFIIPFIGLWLNAITKEVLGAFMAVFSVMLATTILANPMMPVKVKK